MILVLRQVDDFLIGCDNEDIARKLTDKIGKKIQFKLEEEKGTLPITYLGLVEDYNGVDIEQTSRKIKMSAKTYLQRFLQTHGWDTASDGEIQDTSFKDCMKSSRPISPLPPDCVDQLFKQTGPKEGSPEALILEKKSGFVYRTVLGEVMYAYITARPDIGYSVTTLSKFSSDPSAYHYKQLRHVAKYLRSTIGWGIEFTRPKPMSDLPTTEEHTDLPELDEEFPVNINEAVLKGFVDASHGTDFRKMRSITGLIFTFCGGAVVYRSKTQSLTAGSSTEA